MCFVCWVVGSISRVEIRVDYYYISHAMTSVNDADVVLWPRHEVHQLVNTPLAQHGKHLTHSLVMDIARQLAKIQSSDKSIRYVIDIVQ